VSISGFVVAGEAGSARQQGYIAAGGSIFRSLAGLQFFNSGGSEKLDPVPGATNERNNAAARRTKTSALARLLVESTGRPCAEITHA
jgi:hypothetical protein